MVNHESANDYRLQIRSFAKGEVLAKAKFNMITDEGFVDENGFFRYKKPTAVRKRFQKHKTFQ